MVPRHAIHESQGWTAFLKEVAPTTIIGISTGERRDAEQDITREQQKQQDSLERIYDLARQEEGSGRSAVGEFTRFGHRICPDADILITVDASAHCPWCEDGLKLADTAQPDVKGPGRVSEAPKRASESLVLTRGGKRNKRPVSKDLAFRVNDGLPDDGPPIRALEQDDGNSELAFIAQIPMDMRSPQHNALPSYQTWSGGDPFTNYGNICDDLTSTQPFFSTPMSRNSIFAPAQFPHLPPDYEPGHSDTIPNTPSSIPEQNYL